MKYTEQNIQHRIFSHFSNCEYRLFNVYLFNDECDFFCITKTGYAIEIEIKISRSDYKADLKKTQKHEKYGDKTKTYKPNRFYYAVPNGLILPEEIPEYAGLIYVDGWNLKVVKNAPLLHKNKPMEKIVFVKQLLTKYYYRYMEIMKKYEIRNWEAKFKQQVIKF